MTSRAVLLAVAALAAGWMVLSLRTIDREEAASQIALIADPQVSPREIRGAHRAFARAGELNPDSGPEFNRAVFDVRSGHPQDAVGVLRDVLRREPANVNAWALLIQAGGRSDPAVTREARARIRALSPLG